MKKIIGMWLAEKNEVEGSATGLILKLEDGMVLQHQSTDVIMPFEPHKFPAVPKED